MCKQDLSSMKHHEAKVASVKLIRNLL
ncbi:rCG32019 [Rattus norvegicus]|uniref:RCG32019 n=1 Tax=Rattus norvegicus TaxID=10116 RepID=A6KDR9_RAT|nr:rCG32019 [Rattus norvegicus]